MRSLFLYSLALTFSQVATAKIISLVPMEVKTADIVLEDGRTAKTSGVSFLVTDAPSNYTDESNEALVTSTVQGNFPEMDFLRQVALGYTKLLNLKSLLNGEKEESFFDADHQTLDKILYKVIGREKALQLYHQFEYFDVKILPWNIKDESGEVIESGISFSLKDKADESRDQLTESEALGHITPNSATEPSEFSKWAKHHPLEYPHLRLISKLVSKKDWIEKGTFGDKIREKHKKLKEIQENINSLGSLQGALRFALMSLKTANLAFPQLAVHLYDKVQQIEAARQAWELYERKMKELIKGLEDVYIFHGQKALNSAIIDS